MGIVYVCDNSGANPRRKPKRRKPCYRNEMWEYLTVTMNIVQATNFNDAQRIAYQSGFGDIVDFRPVKFKDIKIGDKVTRLLAGIIPMELQVTDVTNNRIICGSWEFDRDSGIEIDEYISIPVSHLIR